MSATLSYKFLSCTDLLTFARTMRMSLSWNADPGSFATFGRMELYRYIGDYMAPSDPNEINSNNSALLLRYQYINKTSYSKAAFIPIGSTETISGILKGTFSFEDDFSALANNSYDIQAQHNFTARITNFNILSDIKYGRRTIHYFIKVYSLGATDSAPYFIMPNAHHIVNNSTKTQVRHDYLHYEGDEMWVAFPSAGVGQFSRTAVDINRAYLDSLHAGPTGRGGSVFVSDRTGGRGVYQFDLKNGAERHRFQDGRAGSGHGIAVHAENGNCISGPSGNIVINNVQTGRITTTHSGIDPHYGIMPIYGQPDKFIVTRYLSHPYCFTINKDSETVTFQPLTNLGFKAGYAATSCPNGCVLQASHSSGSQYINVISGITNTYKYMAPDTDLSFGGTTRVSVDAYNMYPNTIIDEEPSRNRFCVTAGDEACVTMNDTSPMTYHWTTGSMPAKSYANSAYGYDGENNFWGVTSSNKTKMYRTAGEWVAGDGHKTVFPFGGDSTYPAVDLIEYPASTFNTREIEWFLTRNSGVRTVNAQSDRSFTTLSTIVKTSLDNTIPVKWRDGADAQTAYEAWWSLVDSRMYRVERATAGDDKFFYVFDDNNNPTPSALHKQWGIRMKAELCTTASLVSNLSKDTYYVTQMGTWKPLMIKMIRAWAAAFTDPTTAYTTVSIEGSKRIQCLTDNKRGTPIHPFYKYSTPVFPDQSDLTINPALPAATADKIRLYHTNLRQYSFQAPLINHIYMYSDFTGNILMGLIEYTTLGQAFTYPAPTSPSISYALTDIQGNTIGTNDTPVSCFPWNSENNTLSSFINSVTSYDDAEVSIRATLNMGSYLVSSVTLNTNDFYPSFNTDTDKQLLINTPINIAYNPSNVYNNTCMFDYTYKSPSIGGIIHFGHPVSGFKVLHGNGTYMPIASAEVFDLYATPGQLTSVSTLVSGAKITVAERHPEARFSLVPVEDRDTRSSFFVHNTHGQPCE